MHWFDSVDTNQLPTQFYYNVGEVEHAAGKAMTVVIHAVTAFIATIIMSFVIGYLFALCLLIFVVVIIVIEFFKGKLNVKIENFDAEMFKRSGSEAEQTLNAVKIVKAYGQETNEINKFKSNLSKYDQEFRRFSKLNGL